MITFIDQAPAIFGNTWHLFCELRGVETITKKRNAYQDIVDRQNIPKRHSVFFTFLAKARVANRGRLKYWAFVNIVSNVARGVGKSAETAFA